MTDDASRPAKPHPDAVWDARNEVWIEPDTRTDAQKSADEAAAEAAKTGTWEVHGFRRRYPDGADYPRRDSPRR